VKDQPDLRLGRMMLLKPGTPLGARLYFQRLAEFNHRSGPATGLLSLLEASDLGDVLVVMRHNEFAPLTQASAADLRVLTQARPIDLLRQHIGRLVTPLPDHGDELQNIGVL